MLLGTGEPWMEGALLGLAPSFPGRAAGIAAFSEEARASSRLHPYLLACSLALWRANCGLEVSV